MGSFDAADSMVHSPDNGQDADLADLVRGALEREGVDGWKVKLLDIWCEIEPSGYQWRDQGWKLHVSATRGSATAVLERSLDVLLHHRCAFKFAKSTEHAALLCSAHYSRGGAGKFLTAYPDDDEHFRSIARELDRVTAGLPGPAILSDRPYRPGSLVHYRYGAFAGKTLLTNDGAYRAVLECPDGTLIEDRRDAWFAPPAWASSPLEEEAALVAGVAGQVRLADRFVVHEAIRHAYRGGVYRATDTRTGTEVVVKHARPHVEVGEDGRDVRSAVRHEAEVLDLLAPLGVTPCKVELLESGGHVFLAEELVPGTRLHQWVAERLDGMPGLQAHLVSCVIRRLAEVLAAIHGVGLAVRDLAPGNVLVDADERLRLVDLELAAPLGAEAIPRGTPGYMAPEQARVPVSTAEDLYSLGAVAFLLATGIDPGFLEDAPAVRSAHERLEGWLAMTAAHSEAARRLAPLILGLTEEEPERRWDLDRVRAFLDGQERIPAAPRAGGPDLDGQRLPDSDQQRLIDDGLAHLLATMDPDDPDRLWPSTSLGETTDPCNVQHGAAGVLAVLTRAAQRYGDACLRDALATTCAWIERRLPAEPRLLPGLHFGRSGTAWALFDAARALGDAPMAERALALAKRIPVTWPNPDVTHGAAGAGLVQLELWQATGDDEFRQRVERCADRLVAAAEPTPTGVVWTVPASFDSAFAGSTHYGFAHGAAGVAWFLLAAGIATDRSDYLATARAAGQTLCAAARRDHRGATWGEGPGDEAAGWVHWCHGSSGVGTFLVRLWQTTGEDRYRELAELAAVAVRRDRWVAAPTVCHGLAGNGDFLLDMAAALGEPRYRAGAEELAAVIFANRVYRDGRIVVPDDSWGGVAADYGVGLAGVVGFLLRLRHGGPRMWIPAPVAVGAAQ